VIPIDIRTTVIHILVCLGHYNSMFNDIKRLPKPPENLEVIGGLMEADERNIVVIGSRNISSYGRKVIDVLVPKLVKAGFTIISGLAPGCDSYAQETALASGGRTIGVLGYGLDHIKKDRNLVFIERVLREQRGVLISPFKRDQPPTRESFIYRNSVMATLGQSVLVVEAKRRSGVFHTVNFALELGRPIMAIPGNIFRFNSAGVHALIKEGASPVSSMADILEIIG